MIPGTTERIGDGHHSARLGHPEEEILLLPEHALLPVTADLFEVRAPEHGRAMRKGSVARAARQAPTVPRARAPAAGVYAVGEPPYDRYPGVSPHDLPLPHQPVR